MFKVPIVYVCFNRPKLTKKTFEYIKKIKPSKLFLILDGPRKNNKQDKINCLKVKKIIQNINWKCKLYFYSTPLSFTHVGRHFEV